MILPIRVYGDPILTKVATDIDKSYTGLSELIENMFATMYNADGIGLAAPQVGLFIRLFVVDASPLEKSIPAAKGFKKIFINPHITERSGGDDVTEEGCLSVPGIRENVCRKERVRIKYFDKNWDAHEDTYEGYLARILQHETDHLDGVLFVKHCSQLRKKLIRRKLTAITKGDVDVSYRISIPR